MDGTLPSLSLLGQAVVRNHVIHLAWMAEDFLLSNGSGQLHSSLVVDYGDTTNSSWKKLFKVPQRTRAKGGRGERVLACHSLSKSWKKL
jgi:hypothetical protein